MKEIIIYLRKKPRYKKLLNILVLNGLLDIIEDIKNPNDIDYIKLITELLIFLKENKKHYENIKSENFNYVVALCIDEVMLKKFNIDIDDEKLEMIVNLLKNSVFIKKFLGVIKTFLSEIVKKLKCNKCKKIDDVVITQEQDSI